MKTLMDYSFPQFVMNTYDDVKPYFDDLLSRELHTQEDTFQWLKDYDALASHIQEDSTSREVNLTRYTQNEEYKNRFEEYINTISPLLQEVYNELDKKIITLPYIENIATQDEAYGILYKGTKKDLDMFRSENIPLKVEEANLEKEYGEIAGAMMIEYDGKTMTLQQASVYLQSPDRAVRETVYKLVWDRRLQDAEKLDKLLSKLIAVRNRIAKNAGYESFVEYQWDRYHRFDYTQTDVDNFHKGVKEHIVPLAMSIFEAKKQQLGIDTMRPYDLDGTPVREQPLKPFEQADDLLEKGIQVMGKVKPEFAENLLVMKNGGHFDLASRENKRPGGYQADFPVTGYPFIFMNAAGTQRDVETFVHEAGHAMHNFSMKDLTLNAFKHYPMEIAEVASMSMELVTMPHWDIFYSNQDDLKKAQMDNLNGAITVMPWISIIDQFQYWLYKNPDHTVEERNQKFSSLVSEYQPWIDYAGLEKHRNKSWQRQLHIFEVPFYYIEYGIAQLGAFGVWRNYLQNAQTGLQKYIDALSLGYTKKLPILYETAGLSFDFSPAKIKELMDFVREQRDDLEK